MKVYYLYELSKLFTMDGAQRQILFEVILILLTLIVPIICLRSVPKYKKQIILIFSGIWLCTALCFMNTYIKHAQFIIEQAQMEKEGALNPFGAFRSVKKFVAACKQIGKSLRSSGKIKEAEKVEAILKEVEDARRLNPEITMDGLKRKGRVSEDDIALLKRYGVEQPLFTKPLLRSIKIPESVKDPRVRSVFGDMGEVPGSLGKKIMRGDAAEALENGDFLLINCKPVQDLPGQYKIMNIGTETGSSIIVDKQTGIVLDLTNGKVFEKPLDPGFVKDLEALRKKPNFTQADVDAWGNKYKEYLPNLHKQMPDVFNNLDLDLTERIKQGPVAAKGTLKPAKAVQKSVPEVNRESGASIEAAPVAEPKPAVKSKPVVEPTNPEVQPDVEIEPNVEIEPGTFSNTSPLSSSANPASPQKNLSDKVKAFAQKMLAGNSEEADAWKQMNDRATVAKTARSYLISKADEIKKLRSKLEGIDPASPKFDEELKNLRDAQLKLSNEVDAIKKEFHGVPQSVENALRVDPLNLADIGPEAFITNNGKLTLRYPMSAEQAANMASKPGIRIESKDPNGNFILEFNKADYGKSLSPGDMEQFIKDVTPTADPFKTIQPGDINEALIKAQFDRVLALERKYAVQRMAGQDTAAISGELQKARGVLSALENTTTTNVDDVVGKIQEHIKNVGFKGYDPRTGRIAIKPKDELIKEIHNTFPNEDALKLLKERGFEVVEPGQTYMPPVTLSGGDALPSITHSGPEAKHFMIIPENVDVGDGIMIPNHFRPVIHRNGDVHVKARKGSKFNLNTQDNASNVQSNPKGIQINDNVAIFNQDHKLYGILKDNAKPSAGVITNKIWRWGGKVDPVTKEKGIGILPKIVVPGAVWEAAADFTYPKVSPHHLLGDIIRWAKEPNTQTAANANPGAATANTKTTPTGSGKGTATTGGSPEAIADNNKENNTAESIGNALDPYVFSPFRGNKMNIGGYPIGHSIFGALAGGALGAGIGGLNYILTDENELSEEEKKKRSLARAMLSSAGIGAGIGGAIGGVSDFSKS